MGVAVRLLLEYGVSSAAVAVGWSQYLNELSANVFDGWQLPDQIIAAPWDEIAEGHVQGWINLPAVVLVLLFALLLIRSARAASAARRPTV